MSYEEAIQYLYTAAPLFQQQGAAAYKPGLQTTEALDAHFGHPHRRYATLHVAGTNGKGSVCHTLAATLQSAGLKTGLYTSPHLTDFRERIRINGQMIPRQRVVRFIKEEHALFETLHPSFFEITTALAFLYFAEENVDVAVIETGLGGRIDCTNIIRPELSIVTNISLDHTDLLGKTLSDIATEKAGIFKAGVPAVVGEATEETRAVFEAKAKNVGAPLYFAEDEPEVLASSLNAQGKRLYETRHFGQIEGELSAPCQEKNANTLLCAIQQLPESPLRAALCSAENLRRGFAHVCDLTGLQGRWQTLQEHPRIVCDTGHNAGGWQYLAQQLNEVPAHRLHIILGMAADKDVRAVLSQLPKGAHYYWTQASVRRAMLADKLAALAESAGLRGGTPYPTPAEALQAARAQAAEDDTIFIGGSTFVVADILGTMQ